MSTRLLKYVHNRRTEKTLVRTSVSPPRMLMLALLPVYPLCLDRSSVNHQIPHAVRYQMNKLISSHPEVTVCTSTTAAFLIQTCKWAHSQTNKSTETMSQRRWGLVWPHRPVIAQQLLGLRWWRSAAVMSAPEGVSHPPGGSCTIPTRSLLRGGRWWGDVDAAPCFGSAWEDGKQALVHKPPFVSRLSRFLYRHLLMFFSRTAELKAKSIFQPSATGDLLSLKKGVALHLYMNQLPKGAAQMHVKLWVSLTGTRSLFISVLASARRAAIVLSSCPAGQRINEGIHPISILKQFQTKTPRLAFIGILSSQSMRALHTQCEPSIGTSNPVCRDTRSSRGFCPTRWTTVFHWKPGSLCDSSLPGGTENPAGPFVSQDWVGWLR